MLDIRSISKNRWWHKKKTWLLIGLLLFLVFVRFSKGSLYKDFYYFISKPFWPGNFQREILTESFDKELLIKFKQVSKDNKRLREILSLQRLSEADTITAAVISRKNGSWWRQLILNKGSKDGVKIGSPVIGPGGLLGRVDDISPFTSTVKLLTSPESKVGVWIDRTQNNALLVGSGNDDPKLIFYTKDVNLKVGDVISSSPASTLLPPNIPVGVIKSLDQKKSNQTANVLLFGKPQAIDWVQILRVKS